MSVRQDVVPVAAVVLTFNEERNLDACLRSVAGWVQEIVVIDSGSTDTTTAIARRHGARVLTHPFESHAQQWQWAFAEAGLESPWVLGLDADQQVTPELRASIGEAVSAGRDGVAGYFVNRRQIFRGTWIRHGGYYPKYLLKLFRRGQVSIDAADLVDHHFHVAGPTGKLRGDLIEDNRNEEDIAVWIAKHNRYAVRQAEQELRETERGDGARPVSLFGDPDARTRWMKRAWRRLPLFVRPALYFFYRYVVRLGFLDGVQGFIFHYLQGYWYRMLVDINIYDLRRQSRLSAAPPPHEASSLAEAGQAHER